MMDRFPRPSGSGAKVRRRRTLFFALSCLLILSTSPLFGHHLESGAGLLFAGRDHVLSFCLIALHLILLPIHQIFHFLLYAGLGYAVFDRLRAYREMRAVLNAVESRRPEEGGVISTAAARAGVDARHILVVDGLPGSAFTVGGWRPRILISSELPRLLSVEEVASVLAHEESHRRSRDPFTISLLRFVSCTLFFIPAMRRLAEDISDEVELVADDFAAVRGPLALASAILAVAGDKGVRSGRGAFPAVGFDRDSMLDRRVKRLLGAETRSASHLTRRSLRQAAVTLSMVWTSGLMMIHPLPPEVSSGTMGPVHPSHRSHCQHHGINAFAHLFCLGGLHASGDKCPHSAGPH